MNLTYEAVDTRGRQVSDKIQASSIKEGMDQLQKKGLMVTQIEPDKGGSGADGSNEAAIEKLHDLKLPLNQLTLFTRQMAMLLASGSALVPALEAVGEQMNRPEQRRMFQLVKDDLEGGLPLTDALRKFHRTFDSSYCAVIAAGEASATLPKMFAQLATIINKRRSMRNKIVGAMIYPLLLISLSISILGIMMFFVVPRFTTMFDSLGVPLPATTKILIDAGDGFKTYWPLVLVAIVGSVVGLVLLIKTEAGKQFLSNVQIRIPVLGRLMSRLIQGKMFRILGMLLESRVGLLEALELARGVTANNRYQQLFTSLDDAVTRGESISGTLQEAGLINLSFCQAIRTGEQSGKLGESITYVADILDEENAELLNTTTKLVEPLILIVMGVIVGAVAISLFMPLFDMTSAI